MEHQQQHDRQQNQRPLFVVWVNNERVVLRVPKDSWEEATATAATSAASRTAGGLNETRGEGYCHRGGASSGSSRHPGRGHGRGSPLRQRNRSEADQSMTNFAAAPKTPDCTNNTSAATASTTPNCQRERDRTACDQDSGLQAERSVVTTLRLLVVSVPLSASLPTPLTSLTSTRDKEKEKSAGGISDQQPVIDDTTSCSSLLSRSSSRNRGQNSCTPVVELKVEKVSPNYLVFPAPPSGRLTALQIDEGTYMCVRCTYEQPQH